MKVLPLHLSIWENKGIALLHPDLDMLSGLSCDRKCAADQLKMQTRNSSTKGTTTITTITSLYKSYQKGKKPQEVQVVINSCLDDHSACHWMWTNKAGDAVNISENSNTTLEMEPVWDR